MLAQICPKCKLYNQYIILAMIYGSETWKLTEVMVTKLSSPQSTGEIIVGNNTETQEEAKLDTIADWSEKHCTGDMGAEVELGWADSYSGGWPAKQMCH